jgi:hypothetical protein
MKYFENTVNQIVREAIASGEFSSEFFQGTLFLNATEDNARAAFHRLTEYCGLGHVLLTKITHGEYAYDFV